MIPAGLAQPHQKQTQDAASLPRFGGQGGVGAGCVCSWLLWARTWRSQEGGNIVLEPYGSAWSQTELECTEIIEGSAPMFQLWHLPCHLLLWMKRSALDLGWSQARGSYWMDQQWVPQWQPVHRLVIDMCDGYRLSPQHPFYPRGPSWSLHFPF